MGEFDAIPPRILAGLRRYVEAGIQPGDFLTAVLENRFLQAVCRADDDCAQVLQEIAHYVFNEIPDACWGSPEAVRSWTEKRRREEHGEAITGEGQVAGSQARTQARAA